MHRPRTTNGIADLGKLAPGTGQERGLIILSSFREGTGYPSSQYCKRTESNRSLICGTRQWTSSLLPLFSSIIEAILYMREQLPKVRNPSDIVSVLSEKKLFFLRGLLRLAGMTSPLREINTLNEASVLRQRSNETCRASEFFCFWKESERDRASTNISAKARDIRNSSSVLGLCKVP